MRVGSGINLGDRLFRGLTLVVAVGAIVLLALLIVYLFRGQAISRSLLLAFSVGMNIAITVANLAMGFVAIGLMAKTLSFKRLRQLSRREQEQPA